MPSKNVPLQIHLLEGQGGFTPELRPSFLGRFGSTITDPPFGGREGDDAPLQNAPEHLCLQRRHDLSMSHRINQQTKSMRGVDSRPAGWSF